MASGIYNRWKYNLMKKIVDMDADDLKVMLLTSSHSFNADDDLRGDINSNEISGTGYTTNGQSLSNTTVTQDDTNDRAVFDADDIAWTTSTFTARHAVIYDDTVASDPLICSIDFGTDKTVSGGTFTIQWSANGILRLT